MLLGTSFDDINTTGILQSCLCDLINLFEWFFVKRRIHFMYLYMYYVYIMFRCSLEFLLENSSLVLILTQSLTKHKSTSMYFAHFASHSILHSLPFFAILWALYVVIDNILLLFENRYRWLKWCQPHLHYNLSYVYV